MLLLVALHLLVAAILFAVGARLPKRAVMGLALVAPRRLVPLVRRRRSPRCSTTSSGPPRSPGSRPSTSASRSGSTASPCSWPSSSPASARWCSATRAATSAPRRPRPPHPLRRRLRRLRRRHARPGPGRRRVDAVHLLGGHDDHVVPPHRARRRDARGPGRRPPGPPGHRGRWPGPARRPGHRVPGGRHHRPRRAGPGRHVPGRRAGRPGPDPHRRHGQVGPGAVPVLAAGGHGRAHAGERLPPLGHHGEGRGDPHRPPRPPVRRGGLVAPHASSPSVGSPCSTAGSAPSASTTPSCSWPTAPCPSWACWWCSSASGTRRRPPPAWPCSWPTPCSRRPCSSWSGSSTTPPAPATSAASRACAPPCPGWPGSPRWSPPP